MQRINSLLQRVEIVDCYIRVFAGSFPRIFEETNRRTHAHLIVVAECLPFLRRLLGFIRESVPVIEKMTSIVSEGSNHLSKASNNLGEIDQTAERAVQEILDVMEAVRGDLKLAVAADDCGPEAKERIGSATDHLLSMIGSLQFQDITSQRVRATIALLADMDTKLLSLIEDCEGQEAITGIKVAKGTYDDMASFDRETSAQKQKEVDILVASGGLSEEV